MEAFLDPAVFRLPPYLINTETADLRHVISRELQREKVWSRIHLVPMLMAEGDRELYRRQQAAVVREREIMKDVPGWEVGVYVWVS